MHAPLSSRIAAIVGCGLLIVTTRFAAAPAAQARSAQRATFTSLAFYVGAHQDDWLLFRGNAASRDLANASGKVVFVYATAGDAGQTNGWWEARERGAVAAVRRGVGAAPLTIDVARVNGHPIVRYTCGNSVSYFLRLPDGKYLAGTGYPAYNNESLSQLRDSGKPMTAVDKSTTYQSWKDFVQTLQAIMEHERSPMPAASHPAVNAPDYFGSDNSRQDCSSSDTCNRCDHPDHIAVGQALRQFVAGTYNRTWWVGYETQDRPENLAGADFARKGELFFAYASAVENETMLNGKPARPDLQEWRNWGARDYTRTVRPDQPDPDKPVCGAASEGRSLGRSR
jgi:GlcNAc-PI de-N-acetylase